MCPLLALPISEIQLIVQMNLALKHNSINGTKHQTKASKTCQNIYVQFRIHTRYNEYGMAEMKHAR